MLVAPDVCFSLHSTLARSLNRNSIGAEGAKHVSEALKTNSTLQTLGYAAGIVFLLSAALDVCISCARLPLAAWTGMGLVQQAPSTSLKRSRATPPCSSCRTSPHTPFSLRELLFCACFCAKTSVAADTAFAILFAVSSATGWA